MFILFVYLVSMLAAFASGIIAPKSDFWAWTLLVTGWFGMSYGLHSSALNELPGLAAFLGLVFSIVLATTAFAGTDEEEKSK
jgi:CHASE2 domain-containing sensor protein